MLGTHDHLPLQHQRSMLPCVMPCACCLISRVQLDQKLGSELQENWGLDVLVRVGETWLPKLQDAGGVPAGQSSGGNKASTGEEGEPGGKTDVPLLKLFEFLTASLCLYVIEEESTGCPLRRMANVFSAARAGDCPDGWVGTGRGGALHGVLVVAFTTSLPAMCSIVKHPSCVKCGSGVCPQQMYTCA